MKRTTILLVDDHALVREGLRSLLGQRPEMHVIAEAETGRAAVSLAAEHAPDVVLLDICLPDMNGIEAAAQIRTECPHAKIVALSVHSDRRFVVRMLEAGASGYLIKSCELDEVARAIDSGGRGGTSGRPAGGGGGGAPAGGGRHAGDLTESRLSSREREVLQLIAEGTSTKDIAARLHLSVKTVETHRAQIMAKLGLHSVAELTKYAIREGLTSLET